VLAADHGESLGEHGVCVQPRDDVYGESTRVPLAHSLAGASRRRGRLLTPPSSSRTLRRRFLDLVGIPARLGGSSLFQPRQYARSICFDRAANRLARASGAIDRPTYRMVALAGVDGTFVHRDAPGGTDQWSGTGDPPLAEAEALLERPVASTDRDPLDARAARALGYTE
jgi:hypothetical protein